MGESVKISGSVRRAAVLLAALAVGACAGSDISPVGPEIEAAFAKGGNKSTAPGQVKKGGGGGGGGTSEYQFDVSARVDFNASSGFTFDIEYPVGTSAMGTAGTAAPCPTGALPTNVANGASISWARVQVTGGDIRCKLAGIQWQQDGIGLYPVRLNIALPNSWDDGRQKGHFDLTFTGRQIGMASPPWSVDISAFTCPISTCDPQLYFLDQLDYDVVWGSGTVSIRKKVPFILPDLTLVDFRPGFRTIILP